MNKPLLVFPDQSQFVLQCKSNSPTFYMVGARLPGEEQVNFLVKCSDSNPKTHLEQIKEAVCSKFFSELDKTDPFENEFLYLNNIIPFQSLLNAVNNDTPSAALPCEKVAYQSLS